jgi:hypothetical protein
MNCHGGAYDDVRHLAKNARFLPLDPAMVRFASGEGVPEGLTRPGQEERVRAINAMAVETPLTGAQRGLLDRLYTGSVLVSGTPATGDDVPPAWTGSASDHDFYRGVVKPYCGTCHLAAQRQLADAEIWSYGIFASPAAFDAAPLDSFVCNTFSMPNAQPTSLGFWDAEGNPGVDVAGTIFPAAADALLARRRLDRSSCGGFGDVSGCSRSPDPDALCGGSVSGGAICDRTADRCAPMISTSP